VAGCCECGDEPSGSCATELVNKHMSPVSFEYNGCRTCVFQGGLDRWDTCSKHGRHERSVVLEHLGGVGVSY
jgi:hypothetical protein